MAQHRFRKLCVFISSTADLTTERDAVMSVLGDLDIDGSRFEAWPSTPKAPMDECLARVDEADAVILLMGARYGTKLPTELSATHMEYRRAKKCSRPVYCFRINNDQMEEDQLKFFHEVRTDRFQCRPVRSIDQLVAEVRTSLLSEFARCFREVYGTLPERLQPPQESGKAQPCESLRPDEKEAAQQLHALYNQGDDLGIHAMAADAEQDYSNNPVIMAFVYMSEINLGMNGGPADISRIERAVQFWQGAAAQTKFAPESNEYNLGNALGVLGRHNEAIAHFRKSLEFEGENGCCWKNLGESHRALGDFDQARSCYERALEANPGHFEALLSLATLALQREGDASRALEHLERISLAELPQRWRATVSIWKSKSYERLGRLGEAIAAAEDAIKDRSDADWAWHQAANLYVIARHSDPRWLDRAATFWDKFLNRYHEDEDAWAECGFAHWFRREAGKRDAATRAKAAFERALALGFEDDGLAADRLGHLYQDEDDWERARARFEAAVGKDPSQFGYCLGVALGHLGRHAEALKWLLPAAQHHHPDALSWNNVGASYEALGEISQAIDAYNKAVAMDPEYADTLFNLGGLMLNQGRFREAAEVWERALARFPAHALLGNVADCLGARIEDLPAKLEELSRYDGPSGS